MTYYQPLILTAITLWAVFWAGVYIGDKYFGKKYMRLKKYHTEYLKSQVLTCGFAVRNSWNALISLL